MRNLKTKLALLLCAVMMFAALPSAAFTAKADDIVNVAVPDSTISDNLLNKINSAPAELRGTYQTVADYLNRYPLSEPDIPGDLQLQLKDLGADVNVATTIVFNDIILDTSSQMPAVSEVALDITVLVTYTADGESKSDPIDNYMDPGDDPVSLVVPVPVGYLAATSNCVEWTRDGGTAGLSMTGKDNRYSPIDAAGGKTTLKTTAFSPFTMKFVAAEGSTPKPPMLMDGEWKKAADGVRWWYRNSDGTWPTGWAQLAWNGRIDWYYFDAEGYMVTGWVTYGGQKYYLHPVSDGTQGYMYTGWHMIGGKWYYFSETPDSTKGHLLVNTTTPDGYKVDANGVWIP